MSLENALLELAAAIRFHGDCMTGTKTICSTPVTTEAPKATKAKAKVEPKVEPTPEPEEAEVLEEQAQVIEKEIETEVVSYESFISAMQKTVVELTKKLKDSEAAKTKIRAALGGRPKDSIDASEYPTIITAFEKLIA